METFMAAVPRHLQLCLLSTLTFLATSTRDTLVHHLDVDPLTVSPVAPVAPAAPPVAPVAPPVAPPMVSTRGEDQKLQQRARASKWQVRAEAVKSPELEALIKSDSVEGLQLFEELLTDKDNLVRKEAARSGPWTTVLEANQSKGLELFQLLFTDNTSSVRAAAATSPAWKPFVQKNPREAVKFFKQLLTDKKWNVRFAVAKSPMWKFLMETDATDGLHCFEELLSDEAQNVRAMAAKSKVIWFPLLKAKPVEGVRMFKDLFQSKHVEAVALSPAWSYVLEDNRTEGVQLFKLLTTEPDMKPLLKTLKLREKVEFLKLFERLVTVDDRNVRIAALASPAWKALLEQNLTGGIHLFNFLARGKSQNADTLALQAATAIEREGHMLTGDSDSDSEAEGFWPSLKAMSKEMIRQILKDLPSEEQVKLAKDLDLMAQMGDVAFADLVEELPVTKSLVEMLSESEDESLLGQMAEYPITLASKRLVQVASKAREEAIKAREESELRRMEAEELKHIAEEENRMIVILLILVILLAILACLLFLLWYFYPVICQWREAKKLAGAAQRAIKEAESYTVSVSQTPEPPAHLAVFHQYKDVYANPYVLYKYQCLEPVLMHAFRISRLTLEKGLENWDFSSVENSSTDFGQVLASENYQMARNFLDNHEAADLERLMGVCDGIQDSCCKYVSALEDLEDPVEKCMKMYTQAFQAKRGFFDPMIQRIGKKSHAEVHLCGEKGMLRLAEKNALRPQAGLIWDCVRAMLCGHSLAELIEVLKMLKEEHDAKHIRIVQINNRFKRPTSDNWQDIAVYIMFTDNRFNGIVAEIQLSHETFLAVRTKFKAHDAYDGIRFAAEALKVTRQVKIRGCPDSQ